MPTMIAAATPMTFPPTAGVAGQPVELVERLRDQRPRHPQLAIGLAELPVGVRRLDDVDVPVAVGVARPEVPHGRESRRTRQPSDCLLKAASKDCAGGSKSSARRCASASGAPRSRSMPASSHSTEIGPS